MRTTLVVASMRGGGAERVVSHMASYWARRARPVTVLTLFHGPNPSVYPLESAVVHRDLGLTKRHRQPLLDTHAVRAMKPMFDACSSAERGSLLRDIDLVAALRRGLVATRPEVVISFIDETNVRVLLAADSLDAPVIVSERCDPYRHALSDGMMRLRRRLYPRAACLVAPTASIAAYFAGEMRERRHVIHNPVVRPPVVSCANGAAYPGAEAAYPGAEAPGPREGEGAGLREEEGARLQVVAMGRLVDDKGFDLLIRAFASIAAAHPAWSLTIWGIGPRHAALEALARELGVGARVHLAGFTHQPFEALRRADLFVLPSRSEGFPNALCEAMACGRAVVAADCSSAIREIVRDGMDGLIVRAGDVRSLADGLGRLMSNEAERERLGTLAVEVSARFSLDKAMAQWDTVVSGAVRSLRVGA